MVVNHQYNQLSNSDFLNNLIIDFLLKTKEGFSRFLKSFKRFFLIFIIVVPIVLLGVILISFVVLPIIYFVVSKDYRRSKKKVNGYTEKYTLAKNYEKIKLFNKLKKDNDYFIKNEYSLKDLYNLKILFIHPIIKRIYLSGKVRSDLLNKWSDKLYNNISDLSTKKIQMQKANFDAFAEDWDDPSMDVYDLQYGPLLN